MRVIILAAGYGSRMYPLAQDMPKCLLPILKETILGRQLRILKECGLSNITVVAGFHKEKIIEQVGFEVAIRYNPHYEITGNLFTLWTVRDLLDGDTIIMNADVIFTERAVQRLLKCQGDCCLLVDDKSDCDAEAQKVIVDGGFVSGIGKRMPREKAFGEFVMMALVREAGINSFKEALMQSVKRDANLRWVEPFDILAKQECKVGYVLVHSPWAEVDTKKEYEEVLRVWREL